MKRFRKWFIILLVLVLVTVGAFWCSPWPSVLIIRYAFNKGGVETNDALKKHVLVPVEKIPDLEYRANDRDAKLDLYYPVRSVVDTSSMPLVIWIHGGGLVAGSKEHVANYCRILASKNIVVAAIDYSLSPEFTYPRPVLQANEAVSFLVEMLRKRKMQLTGVFLAGDSGGAQIAAQLANTMVNPSYANLVGIQPALLPAQLEGVVLFCGPYDLSASGQNGYSWFMNTVLWSYSGKKDYIDDPVFKTASVLDFVSPTFPRAFISVGNDDPLKEHSYKLARRLGKMGIAIDTMFFSPDYTPALPHEYQFNLDTNAGLEAMEKMVHFIKSTYEK